jgi:hypothetical protein
VLHSWKSFPSKEANKLLKRSGRFWMEEYYDRYIRNEKHFEAEKYYIEQNPVAAGLCRVAEDWPYSSASHPGTAGVPPANPAEPPTSALPHKGPPDDVD